MSENTATAATPQTGDAGTTTGAVTPPATDGVAAATPAADAVNGATGTAGVDASSGADGTPAGDGTADAAGSAGGRAALADIEEAMKDVVDPELGINVVDLGLVYGVHVDDQNVATLDMTLTSAACPLTDVIEDQARQALTTGPGGGLVDDIRINWVWLPPWGPDKITDEGRDQLRSLGFNV
ncbi:metal-sulfur cluster assembly factor [Micromonospora sp. MMS20-R2-23]|uniref:Metal-sulfur cluster assembly factor n=1 Tax=Micromonospora antibiotica TaxID=2807623 RepID=A0ABS3VDA9_9ACTN|nr:metal-sulfur cluster assembly factor [Micromonospora antibiotica]MBW4702196.1 metal-sulfur cluster assembly factor [Micromonospora sp. RL09-050-HVF-A]